MQNRSSWSGFLPARALVMGVRGPGPQAREPQSPAAATTVPVPESLPTNAVASDKAALLAHVAADRAGCMRCKLSETRKTLVVGEGNPDAELVFVGEAPSEQEDLEGRPFIGQAGELLDKMINAMGLSRGQVYLLNIVKCRPPGHRNLDLDEVASCSPFLERQLDILKPKIVVALGEFAARTLLGTDAPLSKLRGSFKPYRSGSKLMPTFHPADLLRTPESKREAWADLQAVARELGLALPAKKG